MAEYIEREALKKFLHQEDFNTPDERWKPESEFAQMIDSVPAADAVEVETIKEWLYKIALNNVGCYLDGDFSVACEEIISRLDGLRRFSEEKKGGEG